MLPANMGCPHDYVLTPDDMRTLSKANILVINGLGMESFLTNALKKVNPKIKQVDSSKGMKNLIPLHEEEGGHDHAHASGMNPHLFASPRQAAQIVRNIAQTLSELDPAGATVYAGQCAKNGDKVRKSGG